MSEAPVTRDAAVEGPPTSTARTELRSMRDYVVDLVAYADEHGEPFLRAELPDSDDWPMARLHSAGAIKPAVERAEEANDWQLTEWARTFVREDAADVYAPCPCGHCGFRNLGDGNFACTYERCDQVFGREELEVSK